MATTPKERVIAQIEHRETDPIPYTLGFDIEMLELLDAHFGNDAWRARLDDAIRRAPAPNLVVDTNGESPTMDAYGTTWRVDRRPFHLLDPALPEPDLTDYRFPDLEPLFSDVWRDQALAGIAALPDHFWVAGFGFGLFERTWTLRGFEGALMDAAGDPGFYTELTERVTEHQLAIVERLLELPVDGIMFSDDWGYQQGVLLGADRWRRFLKPQLARLYDAVHAAGKYTLSHCCGSVVDIIPDMVEAGLDVLESVQPEARGMAPYGLKRRFGDDIAFWGCLGSQSTIPFGTPEEIRAEVGRLCTEMGRGGGYILAPAKALQPGTPIENAEAVVEAFLEYAG